MSTLTEYDQLKSHMHGTIDDYTLERVVNDTKHHKRMCCPYQGGTIRQPKK